MTWFFGIFPHPPDMSGDVENSQTSMFLHPLVCGSPGPKKFLVRSIKIKNNVCWFLVVVSVVVFVFFNISRLWFRWEFHECYLSNQLQAAICQKCWSVGELGVSWETSLGCLTVSQLVQWDTGGGVLDTVQKSADLYLLWEKYTFSWSGEDIFSLGCISIWHFHSWHNILIIVSGELCDKDSTRANVALWQPNLQK